MMSKITSNNYFIYSKDLLSSILLISPFMILYEVLCFILFNNKNYEIRNSADAFIRNYFYKIGDVSQLLYIVILFIMIICYILYNYEKYENYTFSLFYVTLMLIEGLIYSIFLLLIVNGASVFYDAVTFNQKYFYNFYSSIGAGVWEEIFFRLIVYGFLCYIFNFLTNKKYF